MSKLILPMLIVMTLGVSACVVHHPPDGRDGYDNGRNHRDSDNDRRDHRGDDNDRRDDHRDDGRDGRN